MRQFEPWFDEMRTSAEFRREYEGYYQAAKARGVEPENPKAWAYDCFLAVEEEKLAREAIGREARVSRHRVREARVSRHRVREVTSAIVKYGDYPT